jgi:hypothetical protein
MQGSAENKNVGGAGHDCDMGNPQTIGADTRPTLEPWFLTEVPPVDVDPPAGLR